MSTREEASIARHAPPPRAPRRTWPAWLAGGLALAAAWAGLASDAGRRLTGREVAMRERPDSGRYYRLKVALTYRGGPAAFDVVAGCKVSVTYQLDGDRTVGVALAPSVYGLRMDDGAGVVIKLPELCDGETSANGGVPPGFMPFVVVYPDAEAPWSGLGYASEDAYASPLSVLSFGGAQVLAATREEWRAWREAEAGRNIVKPEMLTFNAANPFDHKPWRPGMRFFGDQCLGVTRLELPPAVREAVRPFWPEGRPNYWVPGGEAQSVFATPEIMGNTATGRGAKFEGHLFHFYNNYLGAGGLPRPGQQAMLDVYGNTVPGPLYPAGTDISPNALNPAGEPSPEMLAQDSPSMFRVEVRPELRGFLRCVARGAPQFTGFPEVYPSFNFLSLKVNDSIAGYQIRGDIAPPNYWFERDTHVLKPSGAVLINIFGGL